MSNIVGAIAEHSFRIMFFCHNGRGLPAKRTGILYVLLGLMTASRLLRDALNPEDASLILTALGSVGVFLLMTKILNPSSMSAILLMNTSCALLTSALFALHVDIPYMHEFIFAWGLVAVVVTMNNIVRQAQATQKNKQSSDN